jgi:hypothetical protein
MVQGTAIQGNIIPLPAQGTGKVEVKVTLG